MNRNGCDAPIGLTTLIAYWLAELDPDTEAAVDQHLLGCSRCSAELEQLVEIGMRVRELVRSGTMPAVIPDAFLQRLVADGLRLREYRLGPGDSVDCTVAPDDELLVARLRAPLQGVERLDVVLSALGDEPEQRLDDVPFDRDVEEVLLAPGADVVRRRPAHVQRIRLVAVEPGPERVVGEYVFRHTPWPES